MAENGYDNGPICPYLLTDGDTTAQHTRPSSHYRCGAERTARVVSIHRQTASCMGPAYGRCVEYLARAPEPEPRLPRRGFSFDAFDATAAEGGLLFLMIGMIVFALFAIAPRSGPSASARVGSTPSALDVQAGPTLEKQPDAEPTPTAATATPVPPKAVAAMSVAAPTPSASKVKSYVVRAGDTLFSIARVHNVSVDALAKTNGLSDPRTLRAGLTIRIP